MAFSPRPVALHNARRRRQGEADFQRFASLIDTPATSTFQLPANGHVVVVGPHAGGVTVIAGTRTIPVPVLTAGGLLPLGFLERDTPVSADGEVTLAVLDHERSSFVIAEFPA